MGRLRAVSFAEGCSFVLLLGVAMPLKYLADMPMAVKVAGWLHGALFVLFCVVLAKVHVQYRWSFGQSMFAFVMAWLPLGPFFLERKLKREYSKLPAET